MKLKKESMHRYWFLKVSSRFDTILFQSLFNLLYPKVFFFSGFCSLPYIIVILLLPFYRPIAVFPHLMYKEKIAMYIFM
ncbi:hypothetical protein XELAEV_18015396mg [Xenopus laevis]|uniref:Uncharacterized protein n=1 Tax=Xenopus laevis TaxID=8355 RepID=A0A974DHX6_XENLA|nr:hypothetical protein XELAEV_18015396mg [Xenopus laevis]